MLAASRLWIIGALLLGGCATGGSKISEYVDPQTGVTVRAMASPFVYLRDVHETANEVRDYISIGAVEVNKMGIRRHYLAVTPWGPIDHKRAERIALTLGGQSRDLTLATLEPRSLGVDEPLFRPAWGYIGEIWYVVTPADLRAFAAAPPDLIELKEDGRTLTYITFRRADAALQEFIRDIPDSGASEPKGR